MKYSVPCTCLVFGTCIPLFVIVIAHPIGYKLRPSSTHLMKTQDGVVVGVPPGHELISVKLTLFPINNHRPLSLHETNNANVPLALRLFRELITTISGTIIKQEESARCYDNDDDIFSNSSLSHTHTPPLLTLQPQ